MDFIIDVLVVFPLGIILLRIAGKKTLAEMTTFEIITVLSIGTLISHAVVEEGPWKTAISMSLIVVILLISQFLQLKMPFFELLFVGKATVVIENGMIQYETLRKVRMTEQQLAMRLREKGITSLHEVQTATIEANGQLGYELVQQAKPLTYGDLQEVLRHLQLPADVSLPRVASGEIKGQENLFSRQKLGK